MLDMQSIENFASVNADMSDLIVLFTCSGHYFPSFTRAYQAESSKLDAIMVSRVRSSDL